VEDGRDPKQAAEVPRITAKGEPRVRRGAEQQGVDHARVPLGQGVQRVRQREDDVKVRNRQEVSLPRREPPLFGERLAFGTVAVATGVVAETHGAAAVTRLPMPAERGGAAALDRPERDGLDLGEPVRAPIRVPVRTHDVRQLKPWRRD
jgi:hypothetical protein